ncbi:MAG: SMC-Scp complex subunit ScpB [Omnitrophica WOR_2 bacterium RIFCSPHIGHO2_02_FULL_45_21]|nr:MAG: SMC-Scp complex subunit ScpB [Omnitrophica WOR_2 bacterium RIFCSPHIGHO2_02_FULL_45_21]
MNEETFNKAAIEALLFVSERPLQLEQINPVLENLDASQIRKIILELKSDFEFSGRGLRIEEIAGGFQLVTALETAPLLKKFYKLRDSKQLSGPALETLAIIAYKQPLTRLDIESLRGVNVDGVIKSLSEKNLIRISGRKDVPGRPFVYGTTRQFLEYFGLSSLEDMPKIGEFARSHPAAGGAISKAKSSEPANMLLSLSNKQNESVENKTSGD